MCLRVIDIKTIKEDCPAGTYLNPTNVLCVQAMDKFNRVRIKLLGLPPSSFVYKFSEK
jgi:hypothetical protein